MEDTKARDIEASEAIRQKKDERVEIYLLLGRGVIGIGRIKKIGMRNSVMKWACYREPGIEIRNATCCRKTNYIEENKEGEFF